MNKSKNKKSIKYSLSNFDIFNLLEGKCNVMTYPELTQYDNIDDAMGLYDAVVLLYETQQNFGHWTLFFKYDDNDNETIEFFDPYGLFPDDELEYVPMNFRKIEGEYYPYLTYLLYKSNYDIVYNNHRLQEKKNDINSCGRHVVTRLIFRDLDIDDYFKLIKKTGLSSDQFVLYITNNI